MRRGGTHKRMKILKNARTHKHAQNITLSQIPSLCKGIFAWPSPIMNYSHECQLYFNSVRMICGEFMFPGILYNHVGFPTIIPIINPVKVHTHLP